MSTQKSGELVVSTPHSPTEETRLMVRKMIACGLTPAQACEILNACTLTSFERHYYREIQTGNHMATAAVGATILDIATDRDHDQCVNAALFWLRSRANWRDVRKVETQTQDLPEEKKDKLIEQILDRILKERVAVK